MAGFFHQRIASLEQRLSREPQSPLFARLASHYLQAGRAEDALRLCDEGLSNYPFYSTAHLIKGKALLKLKMMAEAKREFQVVHELLPNNEAVARLHASIDLGPSADFTAAVKKIAPPSTEAPLVKTAAPEEVAAVREPPATVPEELPPQEALAEEQPAAPMDEPQRGEGFTAEPAVEEPQAISPETPPSDDFSTFGEPPVAAAEPAAASFEAEPQPEGADSGFGAPFETPPTVEPPAEEISAAETPGGEPEHAPSLEKAFSQLEQTAQGAEGPAVSEQAQEENPFAAFGAEAPTAEGAVEEEPYDKFAARKRIEYFGSEDTLTLEEYLGSGRTGTSSSEDANRIEEIADKLRTPKKITPVINFTEKALHPPSEADTPASVGFVTPTLAEIYVKQGWYDDAIKAYRALAAYKPAEKGKFDRRIAEIEEMKKQQG
jgi:tetratricopeptide (TPR) repeat protein